VDVITQMLWASIGYTLPAIIGAKLASTPRRRAVLIIGDGALQMTVQELGTVIRHGLEPIIIVLNNDGYTVERAINGPTASYNDVARWNLTDLPCAFGAPHDTVIRRASTTQNSTMHWTPAVNRADGWLLWKSYSTGTICRHCCPSSPTVSPTGTPERTSPTRCTPDA
jgi:TPP-dependent 2-oxoacid decarboxylase